LAAQKARLAALVEHGPIPAVHDVVRWRACELRGRDCKSSHSFLASSVDTDQAAKKWAA
jgi:hypothetical protein